MYNILIPTDFSENANRAISYAVNLFGTDSKYTLVNGYEVPHSGANMLISIADILEKDALQLLSDSRDRLLAQYPELKGNLDVRAVSGAPNVAIRKLTETQDFDLVVMGTKGASGLKEVFVGSVASNTLNDVKIPVLAIPGDADAVVPKTILFAADDKCLSDGKLPDELVDLSNSTGAEVLVVNVVPEGEMKHVGNSADQKSRPDGIFQGVKHSVHFVESNDVNAGIMKFIGENKVDMLAMVTRKNDLFSRMFAKSNTKAMAMHTHIPLLAFH
ncbi:MAG: universal stress protein [Flavobacteriales bacterium]|nr:universal stress protein [Flavobacteriales bacterium]